ncbi:type 1 glutamine amidotransferase [Amycolatopsis thermophila]|uniref:GMP synthase (Glutamine-hydrolyzing) n=1 Tax=Amycolatopsis thermophila TaxID=206084 RepID=A0ABU0EVY6_9PSEU|nr:type 1 glutamine amidotransferase [Amycolatopsis thermophila]MDQ0379484.1 GMP synthase (glutamine-hydrolyzing) [Amycolatopsis thermophila]
MKPIAVITHVDRADVGLVEEIARERDYPLHLVRPYRGDELPDLGRVGAVVAMGGPQSAYDDHPYLREEQRYLAAAVGDEVPVLAICLGSQLLARALGGSAEPGKAGLEAGMITVKPAEGATTEIAGEFFSFHSDSAIPPAGAEILARSDRYLQAWSIGSAFAVQFHPEITMRGVNGLLAVEGPKLEKFGVDVAPMRRDAERYFAEGATDSRTLLNRWFDRLPHLLIRD